MASKKENYEIIINNIYAKFLEFNEIFDIKIKHSEEFNQLIELMSKVTQAIAEEKWPKKCVIQITQENYNKQTDFPYTTADYKSIDYTKTCYKILKYYNPEKRGIDKNTGEEKPINFWQYYIYILRNDIFKRATEIEIEKANSNRIFKISVRNQRKINKMLHAIKIYNKEHPDTLIDLYCSEARALYLDQKICTSEKELDKLLQLNKDSYAYNSSIKKDLLENSEDEKQDTTNPLNEIDINNLLSDFMFFLDRAYVQKMNIKKQNKNDQFLKERFESEIITCYYIQKISNMFHNLTIDDIAYYMDDKKFVSHRIINIFAKKEIELTKLISSKTADTSEIKKFIRKAPVSLETLSCEHNKQKNYGTRRITDFRKFSRKILTQEINSLEDKKNFEYINQLI